MADELSKVIPVSTTLVMHRGSLGDSILIWPFLRRESPCVFVTDGAKARLAARFIAGIEARDIESPRFNQLWQRDSIFEADASVRRVISFIAGPGSTWSSNAARSFPHAQIIHEPANPPRRLDDPALLPLPRLNEHGPLIFHVGAGSSRKRLSVARIVEIMRESSANFPVRFIAGEVEAESWDATERHSFVQAHGTFIHTLDALADTLFSARVFIGFDSGPTHLAAQLGLPTIAIFGPTDPTVWAPIGPSVEILAPPSSRSIDWLAPAAVRASINRLTRPIHSPPPHPLLG